MTDDIFNGIDLEKISQLDFTTTYNLVASAQADIEESNREFREEANQAYVERRRMQTAMEQTAVNTAETNNHLCKVIDNQNDLIDRQKEQLSTQKKQLEAQNRQLEILNSIFASNEDGVQVEKEIIQLIQGLIDSNHPLWNYVKDKGSDAIIANAPVIYMAIKAFLMSKGIVLP